MGERLYSGFTAGQLQGLDTAAVRLLIGERYIEVPQMDSKILPAETPSALNDFGNYASMVNATAEDLADKGQKNICSTAGKVPQTVEKRDINCQKTYIDSGKRGPMPIAIVGMSCRFPGGANSPEEMFRLCSEGKSAWSEVPKARFNIDAFYHPNPEKCDATNVKAGHFLDEDQYGYFDASFFNISPNEAKSMDPRARMHLEGAYEAFENAGVTTSDLVGSDTAVYVGAFNQDYMSIMDRDQRITPLYKATGLGSSMLSNRISHWFDLKGPSVTMDTACSASSAALHSACESLRTGTSKMALVSGANIMLDPDVMMSLSNLNFLSPDGRTYMFDQRANGYARGEGIGTLVLKPLLDALRSNDFVHAIIRNTGINQDGRTPGITLPSAEAQQVLIEKTYRQAGLDVAQTDFFEAHGTGTQAGDKTEAEALTSALRTFDRDPQRPLYVGSVKSLMGHCEGASGVAGVIRSVLALKQQCILPNCNFQFPSDQIDFEKWNIKVPVKAIHWTCSQARRASINSFGYGGTNVHIIIEEFATARLTHNGDKRAPPGESKEKVIVMSANDEESLLRLASNITHYIEHTRDPETFDNLAYTLGQRRTLLRYRLAVYSSGLQDLHKTLGSSKFRTNRTAKKPRLCFVFTGQGAQWPDAQSSVARLGASWSLLEEMLRDSASSKVDEASLSQPLCTALQIALVELLRSWGVSPVAVVGHSSGEFAAAYCAGMLSLEAAMQAAYYRGKYAMELEETQRGDHGAMMAVGLSQDEVQPLLTAVKSGRLVTACVNSPMSVTVSGDKEAMEELQTVLKKRGVFNRMLRVKVAYHSHHMKPIAKKYAESLASIAAKPARPEVRFNSSVFPGIPLETTSEYWIQNLLSPVRFDDAVQRMLADQSHEERRIDFFVEVGPHSALAGPLKQIASSLSASLRPGYMHSIERKKSDIDSMLELACNLFTQGVPIDMEKVNFPSLSAAPQLIVDLPPYPWNHTMRYWHQGRIANNYLQRRFPSHDLLGTMTDDCSELDLKWINQLRLSGVPWLRDHALGDEAIFPGAGYLAMAVEAARQKASLVETPIKGYTLRDVRFSMALTVPDGPDGVTIALSLEPLQESSMAPSKSWDSFRILSYSSGREATEHCHGLISTSIASSIDGSAETFRSPSDSNDVYTKWLKKFSDTLIKLGPTFQLLSRCSAASHNGDTVTCSMTVPDTESSMPYQRESTQVVSAPVLDACLQISALGIVDMVEAFDGPLFPTFLKELYISKNIRDQAGTMFDGRGHSSKLGSREFVGDALMVDETDPVLAVKGVKFVFATASKDSKRKSQVDDKLCWNTVWKPDADFFGQAQVDKHWVHSAMDATEEARNALREKACFFCLRKVLEELSENDHQNLLPHHRHFVRWAQRSVQMAKAGTLTYQTPDWTSIEDEHKINSTLERASEAGPAARLTVQVGTGLPAILRQEVDPLSVMMEDNLLDHYYNDLQYNDRAYSYAAQYIDIAAHKEPSLKILEIGAGTGSCTSFILNALGGTEGTQFRCSSYVFTDISAGFFEKARLNFAPWEEYLEFRTLNIENDPQGQGFEKEGYDLIIAANVLHATTKLDKTMMNVHSLLKPGGKLLLVEVTNMAELSGPLIFGLLPGWWMGVEEGRTESPTLSEDEWEQLLRQTGYTGLDISVRETPDPKKYLLSTMVSSKQVGTPACHGTDVAIIHASDSGIPLAHELSTALKQADWRPDPKVTSIKDSTASEKVYVLIDDERDPVVPRLADPELRAFQQLFSMGKGLLWVTFGGQVASETPEAGSVPGFVRALRSEFGSMKCVTLDLQSPKPASSKTVSTIVSVLGRSLGGDLSSGTVADLEYAERDGLLMIPRLIEDLPANEAVKGNREEPQPQLKPLWQSQSPLQLTMRNVGLLDSFHFVPDKRMQQPLGSQEVEIEVVSTALNFHDLMVAIGQLPDLDGFGVECAGLVTKLGHAVMDLHVGQRVCAMGARCFGTHTRTPRNLVCALPEEMSFELGASIPSVFGTSYYSLYHAARLRRGETVLIHSAGGGVGQACIKLATLIGATVFVTVGSPSKADFMEKTYGLPRSHILNSRDLSFSSKVMALTCGKGVDVIVNSLAGDALRESWGCIAMFGRFIELGKKDSIQNANLGMAPFERSASYIAVGFDLFGAYRGDVVGEVLRDVIGMFSRKELTPIEPITVYPMSDIENAFRLMQSGNHLGKIVLNVGREDLTIPEPLSGPKLSSDATYLIVGGLTGIGAAFAKWMVTRWGAKNLILLSRSGSNAKGGSELLTNLQQLGATVEAVACDVADVEKLATALDYCSKVLPPVRGVIQGAMVLQDAIFLNMTIPKFFAALDPKIKGSKNLHEYFLSRSVDLDFFVMLSSLSGINGNGSQTNYAPGNTYQDALAHHRVAMSLPALAIDVGFVTDVGWSVENWDRIASGIGVTEGVPIDTGHLLRLIEHSIVNSTQNRQGKAAVAPQVSIGIGGTRPDDARYSHIVAGRAHTPTQQLAANEQIPLPDRIVAAGPDREKLQTAILDAFRQKLARLLDFAHDDVHTDDSLSAHGVDSLVAVEIRNWLGREAGANVPMSDITNGKKTIVQMVQGIVQEKLKG
ncbi:MAG: hypothetical protein Q9213_005355 [Squamulea squamosa]